MAGGMLFPMGGAVFSECRTYRYRLERTIAIGKERTVAFIMLNPSTADEHNDEL